jgi:TonB dependent receptor
MEVQTGTYSAQYGAYMGVHINMITKPGTNQLHGNLVEFIRNDAFDARPFFLNPAAKKTVLRQNQYGFELDGPVVIPKLYNGRDKTFFMGSYEGLRTKSQSASTSTLMTPQMFQGNFSQTPTVVKDPFANNAPFPGNIIPSTRLSPISLMLQKYYVVPNLPGITQNLLIALPNVLNTDQTVDRVDQNIGAKIRLFFRYQRQSEEISNGSAVPVNATSVPVFSDNYAGSYTHTLTPNLVSDFRIGRQWFNTNSLNYFYLNNIADAGTQLGIPGFNSDTVTKDPGIPDFNVSNFTGWNNAGSNWFQTDKTLQASEQISWMHGKHSVMAGVELRELVTGRKGCNSSRGTFTFNGQFTGYAPADLMLGIPQTLITPCAAVWGLVAEWRDGFFVLDNWQVSRKLTLNYGLRWELPTVPYTVSGYATELNADQTAAVPSNPPVPGFKFIYPNHKDLAPRFGFAYRITGETVLRGGFGIYYNPNQTNSFTFLNTNPPYSVATTYTSDPTTPTLSLSNPTPSSSYAAAPIPNWITDNWNLPSASMNQWSFGLERELRHSTGLSAQYIGSHSLHLDRNYYNNTPYFPGPGAIQPRRPNQLFGQIRTVQNDQIGNYEGLSISVHQRLTHGMQFNASYTWSHTLDSTANSNNSGNPLNPYNWRAEYANSSFDHRHRVVATYIWELPFFRTNNHFLVAAFGKWQLNGITTLQDGAPFNLSISTDSANTSSQGTQRPNIVHAPAWNCGAGHLTACIDASAFSVPLLYSYGNAGRNLLRGPHMFDTDFSIFKNFPIKERLRFTFRAEAFNVFNNVEYSNPSANIQGATFGNITTTSINNRQIQLGGKISF